MSIEKSSNDNQLVSLSIPDEETTKLIAKTGKVLFALAEFEHSLPESAALEVHTLKLDIAAKLTAIVHEVGTFTEIQVTKCNT